MGRCYGLGRILRGFVSVFYFVRDEVLGFGFFIGLVFYSYRCECKVCGKVRKESFGFEVF